MSFAKDAVDTKQKLIEDGHQVILPTNIEGYASGEKSVENKWEKIDADVIKNYYQEIKNCDGILVINKEKNGIDNYLGGNSLIEMAFAYVLEKKIFLLNPIPNGLNYSEEVEAMNPLVINNDLSKIR